MQYLHSMYFPLHFQQQILIKDKTLFTKLNSLNAEFGKLYILSVNFVPLLFIEERKSAERDNST